MDQNMDRVKIQVSNTNFYVNRLNHDKLQNLEIDEETIEKQRKKIQKWIKEKDSYKENIIKQEQKLIDQQKIILKVEQQNIEILNNQQNLQYRLELLADVGITIPLLYLDLQNKTKKIQFYQTIKGLISNGYQALNHQDYQIISQEDKKVIQIQDQRIIDIYSQMMDSIIQKLLNFELIQENQLDNFIKIGDFYSIKLLANYIQQDCQGTIQIEKIRMVDVHNNNQVLFQF